MRAILINPYLKVVDEVDHKDNLIDIKELIQAELFDVVRIANNDVIYVDDEGLFHTEFFFEWSGQGYPLAGMGLIIGTDDDGENVDCKVSLEEATARISFIDRAQALEKFIKLEEAWHKEYGDKPEHILLSAADILKSKEYTK